MSTPANAETNVSAESVDKEAQLLNGQPDAAKHKRLTEWVLEHRGTLHPDIRIVYDSDKGYHVVVAEDKRLAIQTRIASCPMDLTLSILNALNIEPFSDRGTKFPKPFLERYQFANGVLQTFFLMEQYALGSKSWWAPYIDTLPTVEDVDKSQFEAEEDVKWIRGTNLEAAFASQNRKSKNHFEEANNMLKSSEWEHATNGTYSFKLYRWAATIFGSRSFTSQVLDETKPADIARPMGRKEPQHALLSRIFSERFAVLLPLLDVLNHNPKASIEWRAENDHVGLNIQQAYTSGEEVFNNYGPRDNEGLLMAYGFVLEDNPYEHVMISINAHPGSRLENARSWPKDERSNDNWNCYIFDIDHPIVREAKFLERALFSYDLLDSISIVVSNDREMQLMENMRATLMSKYLPNLFDDFRNVLATLAQIMYDSSARARRMDATDPMAGDAIVAPRSQKQKHAQTYRKKQTSILRAAEGVCAFALLNASTDQQASDLLLSMQMKLPELYTTKLEDICSRAVCLTPKGELFTAAALIELVPSPTSNALRSCLKDVENAVLESVPSHMRTNNDRIMTSFSVTLSAICLAHRSGTQLPRRLTTWMEEMTSSYPPEDPNWSYVPPPGPHAPGEEPPPALMTLLGSLPKVTELFAKDSTTKTWLQPEMICWAWNVMMEELVRVPATIEKFLSEDSAQVDGDMGFLMYCKQYA